MIDHPDDWEPHTPDENSPGAAWSPDFPLGDPDAWRDDAQGEDASDADAWRGDIHLPPWPEWNAGPEYRMWKEIAEGE
ncbi:MAG TPA: hypothetical protein VFW98_12365 [Gemmatimonadaceae bacterium]|nr:hypothetical protein [Gemmatimonadaceae bacterium]